MDNALYTAKKWGLAFCLSVILGASTESKGEVKIIDLGQQYDSVTGQSFDIYPRSLQVSQNGLVYVSTPLGFRTYEISTGNLTQEKIFSPSGKRCSFGIYNRDKIELLHNKEYLVMQKNCQILQINTKTLTDEKVLFTLGEDGSSTNSFGISPDQSLLAISTDYCIACIWDIKTKKLIAEYKPGFDDYGDLTFSSDSKILLIAGRNSWFRDSNQLIKYKPYINNIILNNAGYKIKFLTDNKNFISAGDDRNILQKNVLTGKVNVRYKHGTRADTFAISNDEQLVATGGFNDSRIHLFNAKTGKLLKTFEGHTKLIYDLIFSKDNKKLISSSLDHTIRIWNIN
jgi:WD40 repeat protein